MNLHFNFLKNFFDFFSVSEHSQEKRLRQIVNSGLTDLFTVTKAYAFNRFLNCDLWVSPK